MRCLDDNYKNAYHLLILNFVVIGGKILTKKEIPLVIILQ